MTTSTGPRPTSPRPDALGLLREDPRRTRTRVDPFPQRTWLRWLVRLALAVPYIAASFVTSALAVSEGHPNDLEAQRVAAIDWTRADVGWIGDLYPPAGTVIATLVTRIIPLGELGLSLLGALAGGFFLQKVLEAMTQRELRWTTRTLFLVGLGFNPFTFALVTEDALLFLSIGFFLLGTEELVRFLYWSSTRGGFRAGILLMLSALTDPLGLAFVVVGGVAALFYVPDDLARPGRRRASMLVAMFPTIGAFATFLFLMWAFDSLAVRDIAATLDGAGDRLIALVEVARGPEGLLLATAAVLVWILAVVERRTRSIVFSIVAILIYGIAIVLGIGEDATGAGIWLIVYSLVALFVRRAKNPAALGTVSVVAALAIPIVWAAALLNPTVHQWWTALLGG